MLPLNTLNFLFASGGLVLLVVTVGLYLDYFIYKSRFYKKYISQFAFPIIAVTTIGSVATTLLYSEYFGFVPCSLCWLQRIALYPQALFSLMAFKMKERVFFPLYSMALSGFGFIVAVYHYVYQLQPKEVLSNSFMPCLADGSSDCAAKVIEEFGFVTFPLLSAIAFAFLIVMYLNLRRAD